MICSVNCYVQLSRLCLHAGCHCADNKDDSSLEYPCMTSQQTNIHRNSLVNYVSDCHMQRFGPIMIWWWLIMFPRGTTVTQLVMRKISLRTIDLIISLGPIRWITRTRPFGWKIFLTSHRKMWWPLSIEKFWWPWFHEKSLCTWLGENFLWSCSREEIRWPWSGE